MDRRSFLTASLAAGAAVASTAVQSKGASASANNSFKLRYAPHFGMFENSAGKDLVDQLKFMADEGFTAIEDNTMHMRPVEEQEKLARSMSQLGIEMGVFVGYGIGMFDKKTFVLKDKDISQSIVQSMKSAVEVAKRVNAKWCTVVPGAYDQGQERDYQMANAIDNFKRCAEVCEPSGLVMVMEPLNPWKDHAGLFLSKISQGYQICRAVGSPSCKILFDIYHQQITEGNLIPNMEKAWDEIAYFQMGDNPGRNEPGTGEINYKNIFRHIQSKGYKGIMGMEHGNSQPGKEGELAVIEAYRLCDNF